MATSVLLMGSSQYELNLTGDKIRGDINLSNTESIHTVAIHIQNFKGRVWIEASLASDPQEDDWFPIWLTDVTPYV